MNVNVIDERVPVEGDQSLNVIVQAKVGEIDRQGGIKAPRYDFLYSRPWSTTALRLDGSNYRNPSASSHLTTLMDRVNSAGFPATKADWDCKNSCRATFRDNWRRLRQGQMMWLRNCGCRVTVLIGLRYKS